VHPERSAQSLDVTARRVPDLAHDELSGTELLEENRTMRVQLVVAALVASALAAAASAGPAAADSTLVALWHLDEPEGVSIAVDSVGTNNGAISADVVQGVPGDPNVANNGGAYEFSGANPIVKVPHNPTLNPGAGQLVLSAHLAVPANLQPGDYNVIQKGQATAIGGAYKLEVFAPTTTSNSQWGHPDCAVNSLDATTGSKYKMRAYGPITIADGAWHVVQCHLTDTQLFVTIDGAPGKAVARQPGTTSNSVGVTLGGKPNNTHYFRGLADEVSISIG
jgi:uncharacterized membrane protein